MLSKSTIKYIHSLSLKKYRGIHGKFIAEGPKIVSELLESDLKISELFALQEWTETNSEQYANVNSVTTISESELQKISTLSTPNQVLAIVDIPERHFSNAFARESMVIVLDDIRDPGNLGTIIRIADWFGIHHIVCTENCVDAYNPKTVQASMGSIGRVNLYYEDVAGMLQSAAKDVAIYGAFLEGEPIYKVSFAKNGFLVIGNEANGISTEIEKLISNKISIPSGSKTGNHAESLNASIATAIICSEMNRQKGL